MANSLSVQILVNNTVDNVTSNLRSSVSTPTLSSNVIIQSVAVTASAYTQITAGSLTDVRNIFIWNDNTNFTSSVVNLALSSSGGNSIATLWPGDGVNLPWSGSPLPTIYARVASNAPAVNGVVQYSMQQS